MIKQINKQTNKLLLLLAIIFAIGSNGLYAATAAAAADDDAASATTADVLPTQDEADIASRFQQRLEQLTLWKTKIDTDPNDADPNKAEISEKLEKIIKHMLEAKTTNHKKSLLELSSIMDSKIWLQKNEFFAARHVLNKFEQKQNVIDEELRDIASLEQSLKETDNFLSSPHEFPNYVITYVKSLELLQKTRSKVVGFAAQCRSNGTAEKIKTSEKIFKLASEKIISLYRYECKLTDEAEFRNCYFLCNQLECLGAKIVLTNNSNDNILFEVKFCPPLNLSKIDNTICDPDKIRSISIIVIKPSAKDIIKKAEELKEELTKELQKYKKK